MVKPGERKGEAEEKTKLPVEAKNKVFRPGPKPRSVGGLDSLYIAPGI